MSDERISTTGSERPAFPIVAIGASAGGLDALQQLFLGFPKDTGMAFVVIQHLEPHRTSLLSDVLTSGLQMPVVQVADGTPTEPNSVYVIPPDADLTIRDGGVVLLPRPQSRTAHLPIDVFFRALAADASRTAIGVVLSGSASDGTEGLRAIKASGGFTLVQEPGSARFRSMPESAIAAKVVDFVGTPGEIAAELVRLSRDPYVAARGAQVTTPQHNEIGEGEHLQRIIGVIRRHARLDFAGYKRPTLIRRVQRRIALRHGTSWQAYVAALDNEPAEAIALAQDILIHVTGFFRDPEVFEALKLRAFPEILASKQSTDALRVWVPGCATGQEAYTIAIGLFEFLAERHLQNPIKVFGTDLSERAIGVARSGQFSEADLEGVTEERRKRFFEVVNGQFRIVRQIRELCIFVRHDLTRDPPFAKLDLISCRNLLIYFDSELQKRVLPLLHHSLNRPGVLLLGTSEGIREYGSIFTPLDKEHRIFAKTGKSPRMEYPISIERDEESSLPSVRPASRPPPTRDARRHADHILLSRYAPPGVVINDRLEVIEFRGRIGAYLEPAPGQPQVNLLNMAREGLSTPLRHALEIAMQQSIAVRGTGMLAVDGTRSRAVAIEVIPLTIDTSETERHFLVVFEEGDHAAHAGTQAFGGSLRLGGAGEASEPNEILDRLRADLLTSKEHLQAVLVEHQDALDELGAINEELTSANEELQSTNEELQSAKEELQSTNEEQLTLNEELNHKNRELDAVANDLVNVLESVQVPMVMVDQSLRVRRFTPSAREISSLIPSDVGRPIDDVKFKVMPDTLLARIRDAMATVSVKEEEVRATDGRWYRVSIRPYRTTEQRLDGAILSFLDIDVLKQTVLAAECARDYAQSIVDTVPVSLVVLDEDRRVVSANARFNSTFADETSVTDRVGLFELAAGTLACTKLRQAVDDCMVKRAPFQQLEVRCSLPGMGMRDLLVAGSPIQDDRGNPMLLLAFDDITERRLLEASEKQSRVDAERANQAKDLFLATLSHELRTPLSTMLMSSQLLQKSATEEDKVRRASAAIERAVRNQAKLIDDLLDISRIVAGKLILSIQAVDLAEVVRRAVEDVQARADAKLIRLELNTCQLGGPVQGDPSRLQQVVTNLLDNSVKFTPSGGTVSVRLESLGKSAKVVVTDTGRGLEPEAIPKLFDRFVQAESSITRTHGGLGLGLAIVRHLVNVHGGDVRAESAGVGHGSTFTITLPLTSGESVLKAVRRTVVPHIAGVRLLLIEDDDDTREVYTEMLTEQGASVCAVASAAAGLAAVERFVPDVILCDIAMVGEDGYSFVRRLRSGPVGSEIPAAAFTALASEEDRSRALASGFGMHLAKPIGCDELILAIAALVAMGAGESPSQPPPPSARV